MLDLAVALVQDLLDTGTLDHFLAATRCDNAHGLIVMLVIRQVTGQLNNVVQGDGALDYSSGHALVSHF